MAKAKTMYVDEGFGKPSSKVKILKAYGLMTEIEYVDSGENELYPTSCLLAKPKSIKKS